MATSIIKLDSRSNAGATQPDALQVVDPRTPQQRRTRKRKDTHQIHAGLRRALAIRYPRFTASSAFAANESEVTRFGVVDSKLEDVERRLIALEARLGPQSEQQLTVLEWKKRA